MNANWSGVFAKQEVVADALKEVVHRLDDTNDAKKANGLYAALAGGPGIFGLGNRVYDGVPLVGLIDPNKEDRWDLSNDDHINGGVNHFGFPFNFPEEFITAYRLHPLLPDLIESTMRCNGASACRLVGLAPPDPGSAATNTMSQVWSNSRDSSCSASNDATRL